MKHSRRSRPRALAGVLALALLPLAVACGALASPDGWAAPAASGDLVVVHTDSGRLDAFRIGASGATPVWSYPQSDDDPELKAVYATPVIVGDRVYVTDFEGAVLALKVADGRPAAGFTPPNVDGRFVATPALDASGRMVLVTDTGNVHLLNLDSGALSESIAHVDGRVWSSPVLSGDTLYVASLDRRLEAVSIPDGAVQWTDTESPVAGDLVLGAGSLLVGGFDQRVRAFDLSTAGEERWVFDADTWFWARPLVDDRTVYVVDVAGIAFALDADTGVERWRTAASYGEVRAQPVLVGGSLIVATREGTLAAFEVTTGALRWGPMDPDQGRLLANPLVLDSGDVLYVSDTGTLLRVTPGTGDIAVLFERS